MTESPDAVSPPATHYDASYSRFGSDLYSAVRREAFGEDIGQNSWLTAAEQDQFLPGLRLAAGRSLLDIACGSGGPALRVAEKTGCSVTGIDCHRQAIASASALAIQRADGRASFQVTDAALPLPFSEAAFDAVTCIDAINHLPDRPRVLSDWFRVLKPGGRLLFSNPATVTGPLTSAEIAVRSSIGFFLFVPYGYDESVLRQCGFTVLSAENRTANTAEMAERRFRAREARSADLSALEGPDAFAAQQEFLAMAARLARERRLSRFLYLAERTAGTALSRSKSA